MPASWRSPSYDAQGDAGLTQVWVTMAVGLALAALFGFGMTGWYDRKGLHRIPAETEPEKTAARPGEIHTAHPGRRRVCPPGNRSVLFSSDSS
ncbi:hypothetical protein [Streptomyces sp. LUP47B]|jgi:hypothetical protein|uniref:hypothetical protein n=1 Tax=Streptomyces sp. LUP47B TaxID=1890286 RepID=UPI00099FD609